MELEIIYEDASLVAVNKPSGILSVRTTDGKEKSLLDVLTDQIKKRQLLLGDDYAPKVQLRAVHRIDRDVSGVLIFAKGLKEQEELMAQFKEKGIKKSYLAVVAGDFPANKKTGEINIPIND